MNSLLTIPEALQKIKALIQLYSTERRIVISRDEFVKEITHLVSAVDHLLPSRLYGAEQVLIAYADFNNWRPMAVMNEHKEVMEAWINPDSCGPDMARRHLAAHSLQYYDEKHCWCEEQRKKNEQKRLHNLRLKQMALFYIAGLACGAIIGTIVGGFYFFGR